MSSVVMEIEDSSFDSEVIKADTPVLVDFWAPWCGPCKAIGPIVEEIAIEFRNKIKVFKCNVDNNPTTPANYGIKAIPTLIFFKNGNSVEKVTGMVSKSKLQDIINKVII